MSDEMTSNNSTQCKSHDEGNRESADDYGEEYEVREVLSTLPWFAAKETDSNLHLQDCKYYKEIMKSGDSNAEQRNLCIYKMVNHCFPPFWPASFHSMKIQELIFAEAPGAVRKASHFLLANKAHSTRLYHALINGARDNSQKLAENSKNLLSYFLDLRTAETEMLDYPPKCSSAKEFLFEPWILVQLPFHPAILHQWIVAALGVYYKFQEQTAFLRIMSVPEEMKNAVDQLLDLGQKLGVGIEDLLHVLELHSQMATHSDDAGFIDCSIPEFTRFSFRENLSILEFFMSKECSNIIKALMRMAWNKKTQRKCEPVLIIQYLNEKLRKEKGALQKMIYAYKFWQRDTIEHLFGSYFDAFVMKELEKPKKMKKGDKISSKLFAKSEKKDEPRLRLPIDDMNENFFVPVDELKIFLDAKVFQTGWLKGISREKMLEEIDKLDTHKMTVLSFIHNYYRWFEETSRGICNEDTGVHHNIINMQSQVEVNEALAALIAALHYVFNRGDFKKRDQVYFDAVDCEGPKFVLSAITRIIANVPKKDWSMEGILASLKKQCPSPAEETKLPDKELGGDKVAEIFEARVKHIAFTLYENQFGKVKKKEARKTYSELQVVQYMLPAMIAAFLDFDWETQSPHFHGDKSNANKFMMFVHNLISNYSIPNCYFVTDGYPRHFHWLLVKVVHRGFVDLLQWKRDCIIELYKNIFGIRLGCDVYVFRVMCNVFECCFEMLDLWGADKMWKPNFEIWSSHVYQFYVKVYHALEKTALQLQTNIPNPLVCSLTPLVSYGSLLIFFNLIDFFSHVPKETDEMLIWKEELDKQLLKRRDDEEISIEEKSGLTTEEIAAVRTYVALQNVNLTTKLSWKNKWAPFQPFDAIETAFIAYMNEDWWKMKQVLTSWLVADGDKDPSMVSLEYARSNPSLYNHVLEKLDANMRVKMREPGEITFFPVKHCRWCGLVDCADFRVCKECQDTEDYFDINIFCSEKCETEAMEDLHREEHIRFLFQKCKFSK